MLDVVAAAGVEVAGTAVLAARRSHVQRYVPEIHPGRGVARGLRVLRVGAGGVVADEAVDLRLIGVVEGIVP